MVVWHVGSCFFSFGKRLYNANTPAERRGQSTCLKGFYCMNKRIMILTGSMVDCQNHASLDALLAAV